MDMGSWHLRSVDVHTCTVPRTQTWLGDRSFAVARPRLWNNLPVELRQRDICLSELRRLLKTLTSKDAFVLLRLGTLWLFCLSVPCTGTLTYLLTYLITAPTSNMWMPSMEIIDTSVLIYLLLMVLQIMNIACLCHRLECYKFICY